MEYTHMTAKTMAQWIADDLEMAINIGDNRVEEIVHDDPPKIFIRLENGQGFTFTVSEV